MPMRLDEGWNQIQFNLSDFTRRAYGSNYLETLRVQVFHFRLCYLLKQIAVNLHLKFFDKEFTRENCSFLFYLKNHG